jgi:hypothetical protein
MGYNNIMNNTNFKKTIVWIALLTVFSFITPFLLEAFHGELSLGELLSFYASIFGALITLVGVVMTLNYQTRQSMSDDEIKYKPILKIDSVSTGCVDFIGRREIPILFPPSYSINEVEQGVREASYYYRYAEFHMIIKNKGRGEATAVSLDSAKIEDVSWDEKSHLYIGTSLPFSLSDELLVDEPFDIIVTFPKFLFLKKDEDYNSIFIELTLSYNDMFERNRRKLTILSEFRIDPFKKENTPHFYKDGYDYYQVEVRYMGSQQKIEGQ